MTENYFVDQSDLTLAIIIERLKREEAEKQRRWRRVAVAGFVLLCHVLVVGVMLRAKLTNAVHEPPPHRTELVWLLKPQGTMMTKGDREIDRRRETMIRQAYKAMETLPQIFLERPNAITLDEDPGLALGRALACGAGSFEYLTPDGQRRCYRKPWGFTYDRYGYIILAGPHMPKPEKERPSEVLARQRNNAPVCPNNVDPNAPCLDRIIRGN